ncbi:YbdK family carboxylate-amine ligase [Salinibacterium sp. ZJ77]|uniref:carboxylate-amine ligase n=1 Tax=Salinibacterium sp. ZJ77 TaxID=2708337 RepID=UPI00141EF2D9|nr:YbdK family carboxylate-amine ligase [Salinibacterium sp. ZJ77]
MSSESSASAGRYPRFGIEEEFFLLDPADGSPRPAAGEVIAAMAGPARERATREFLASHIESVTGICESADQARDQLLEFRTELAAAASSVGVIAAGTGTPFDAETRPVLTPSDRYADLAERHASLVDDHQVAGLHVHVEVPDPEAAIRGLAALASWLPLLKAVSANSPWWRGRDTGFESWRSVLLRRWTTFGCPPSVSTAGEYAARVAALVGVGGTQDEATLAWDVRISSRYPTVELRAADAQLTADDSLVVVLIARGLVSSAIRRPGAAIAYDPELIDAACWHAARFGFTEGVIAPGGDGLSAIGEATNRLLEALDCPDDELGLIEAHLLHAGASGVGASRQRAAASDGWAPLRDLLALELTRELTAI